MKGLTPSLTILLAMSLFVCSAYYVEKRPKKKKEYNHYPLKDGDVVKFGKEVEGIIKTTSSRGAFDGSRYRWSSDNGAVAIMYASAARGLHQSEFEVSHCIGSISQKGDTSLITGKSIYKKFYVFNVTENYVVDSFAKEVNVCIVTKSLADAKSSLLVSVNNGSLRTVALPRGTKTKEIWKEEHPKETVAEFEYLSIADSEGKQKSYPAGDYVLIGADKLLF